MPTFFDINSTGDVYPSGLRQRKKNHAEKNSKVSENELNLFYSAVGSKRRINNHVNLLYSCVGNMRIKLAQELSETEIAAFLEATTELRKTSGERRFFEALDQSLILKEYLYEFNEHRYYWSCRENFTAEKLALKSSQELMALLLEFERCFVSSDVMEKMSKEFLDRSLFSDALPTKEALHQWLLRFEQLPDKYSTSYNRQENVKAIYSELLGREQVEQEAKNDSLGTFQTTSF